MFTQLYECSNSKYFKSFSDIRVQGQIRDKLGRKNNYTLTRPKEGKAKPFKLNLIVNSNKTYQSLEE